MFVIILGKGGLEKKTQDDGGGGVGLKKKSLFFKLFLGKILNNLIARRVDVNFCASNQNSTVPRYIISAVQHFMLLALFCVSSDLLVL